MTEPATNPELTGEALAAVVAIKVMKWRKSMNRGLYQLPSVIDDEGEEDFRWCRIADFRPDLNIAQAWEVLLAPQDWRAHVWQDADRLWWVRMDHIDTLTCTIPILPDGTLASPVRPCIESHKDFCVAACRAALQAMEARRA